MSRFTAKLSAAVAFAFLLPGALSSQEVPANTKLVVADQGEYFSNLLDASGQKDAITFQLELPNFAGGPAILEAMRAGAIDAAYVGDVPPIQARASGTLLPIVATLHREKSEYRLAVRGGLQIDKLEDLRGKKVSYVEGSGRQAFLIAALNKAGLGLNDVELVPLRVADLPDALRAQAIDVATLQEPHITRLAAQIGVSGVKDPRAEEILPGPWYFYARPETLEDAAKAAALGKFIEVVIKGVNWSNENREAWGKHYYTDFQRISPEETKAILASQSLGHFQTSAEAIPHHQKLIDILFDAKALPESFDAEGSFSTQYDHLIEAAR